MTTGTNRRGYRSPVRAERAARTREAVVVAARELFEAEGFAATTVSAIAARAGVSPQTVYTSFGTKAGLVRAILEQMEESADAAAWRDRIAAERDPRAVLEAFAHWTSAFFTASRPVMDLAADAASELTDLAAQGDAHRRSALEGLVARIDGAGALRSGLSRERAVDRAWLLTGLEAYRGAVVVCGWSPEEFARWLGESLADQLLEPAR